MRAERAAVAAAALLGALLLAAPPTGAVPGGGPLSAAEERGRQLYHDGTSARGDAPQALLGEAGVEVPASALPCGGCHGHDGRGRAEGGVEPSDLTWEVLTRSGGGETPTGRRHPPYDEAALLRAVTMGVDPAGNELHVAMPRYRLSREDAADLVAYLRRLGDEPVPGVEESVVTVGTLLAPAAVPDVARAQEGILGAFFEELNERGGVYGRRLRLTAIEAGTTPEATAERLAAYFDRDEPFALVAPFFAGAEEELARLAEERGVPVVGPLVVAPAFVGTSGGGPPATNVFYLGGGVREEAGAIVAHALGGADGGPASPRWAVLVPEDAARAAPRAARRPGAAATETPAAVALAAIDAHAARRSVPPPRRLEYAAGAHDAAALVRRLAELDVDTLIVVGGALEAARFAAEAGRAGYRPRTYVFSAALSPALAAGAGAGTGPADEGGLRVALPALPGTAAASADAIAELERLTAAAGLPADRATFARRSALAAARLLAVGLDGAGRRLDRPALVAVLESLYRHPTGLFPPFTYGPNRRIGARGAWLVEVEPESGAVSAAEWVESE